MNYPGWDFASGVGQSKKKGVLYMTTAQVLILVAIAIYLLFMLWIGWICAKKNESVDDFYLGAGNWVPLSPP